MVRAGVPPLGGISRLKPELQQIRQFGDTTLVEAAYSPRKADLLSRANRDIEVLRWLVRLAKDRDLCTMRQYGFACKGLTECGRMLGGWLKQSAAKEGAADAPTPPPF